MYINGWCMNLSAERESSLCGNNTDGCMLCSRADWAGIRMMWIICFGFWNIRSAFLTTIIRAARDNKTEVGGHGNCSGGSSPPARFLSLLLLYLLSSAPTPHPHWDGDCFSYFPTALDRVCQMALMVECTYVCTVPRTSVMQPCLRAWRYSEGCLVFTRLFSLTYNFMM